MKNPFKTTSAIKHADWPYIIQHFLYYLLLILASSFFFSGINLIIAVCILTAFLLLVTFFHIYRVQKEESEIQTYKIQALNELYNLIQINAPLPKMTGWAATPELSITILKQIIKHKPTFVVELGSGVSTIINCYGLKNYSPAGKLISIDHDENYAQKTADELKIHRLQDIADIRCAPLTEIDLNGKSYKWYNPEKLHFSKKIDLLVIDGPPFSTQKDARYPAIPFLFNHLSEDAVIVMHDTNRDEESSIIESWLNDFPFFTISKIDSDKGVTILKRKS